MDESGRLTQRTLVLLVLSVTVPSDTAVSNEAMAVPPGECAYSASRLVRVVDLSFLSFSLITKSSAGLTSPKVAFRRFVFPT